MIYIAKSRPLTLFFLLACSLSWGNYLMNSIWPGIPFLFPYGPLFAAIIVAGITCGRAGLKDILERCLRWRVGIKWYAAALLLPVVIALSVVSISILMGKSMSTEDISLYSIILSFPLVMFDAPLGEEPGWWGYALPRFPAGRPALENSLILGVLIAVWHLPIALSGGAIAAPYLIAAFASAILTNWVYYNANESALLALLYHTSANTMGLYFFSRFPGPDQASLFWLLAAMNCILAIVIILVIPGRLSGVERIRNVNSRR